MLTDVSAHRRIAETGMAVMAQPSALSACSLSPTWIAQMVTQTQLSHLDPHPLVRITSDTAGGRVP